MYSTIWLTIQQCVISCLGRLQRAGERCSVFNRKPTQHVWTAVLATSFALHSRKEGCIFFFFFCWHSVAPGLNLVYISGECRVVVAGNRTVCVRRALGARAHSADCWHFFLCCHWDKKKKKKKHLRNLGLGEWIINLLFGLVYLVMQHKKKRQWGI